MVLRLKNTWCVVFSWQAWILELSYQPTASCLFNATL